MPADTPPISEHRLRSTPSLCSTLVVLVKPPEIQRYTTRSDHLESLRLSVQIFRFIPLSPVQSVHRVPGTVAESHVFFNGLAVFSNSAMQF